MARRAQSEAFDCTDRSKGATTENSGLRLGTRFHRALLHARNLAHAMAARREIVRPSLLSVASCEFHGIVGPLLRGDGASTERLSMRRIRDLLRLKFENGLSSRVDRRLAGDQQRGRQRLPATGPGGRTELAAVGRYDRHSPGAAVVSGPAEGVDCSAFRAQLGSGRSGASPHRCDPFPALARIPDRSSGGLWLCLVLRTLRRLEATGVADHAPEPHRRRHHRRHRPAGRSSNRHQSACNLVARRDARSVRPD